MNMMHGAGPATPVIIFWYYYTYYTSFWLTLESLFWSDIIMKKQQNFNKSTLCVSVFVTLPIIIIIPVPRSIIPFSAHSTLLQHIFYFCLLFLILIIIISIYIHSMLCIPYYSRCNVDTIQIRPTLMVYVHVPENVPLFFTKENENKSCKTIMIHDVMEYSS